MKTTLQRSTAALAATWILLLVMAAPASATTHPGTITSGTFTQTKAGWTPRVTDLAPSTGSCPAGEMAVTSSNTTPTGTVDATIDSRTQFFFGGSTAADHYLTVITGGTTVPGGSAGTYDTTTGTIDSLTMRLTIRIYSGGSTGCTPVPSNLKCTWTVTVHLSGTFSGDPAAPASSDSALLAGASTGVVTLGGTCAAPFSGYTGSTVTVTGLGVHIT